MIVVAPRSAALAQKVGVRRIVTAGPLIGAVGLFLLSLMDETTPYVLLALFMCITAAGMAMTMPSFTAGLFSSVPPHKAGVGSAVNDTTRELGGAVGIAVIGSVVTGVYRSNVNRALDVLPPEAADQARRNVGRAAELAGQLRGTLGAERADQLLQAVKDAFVSGGQAGMRVALAMGIVQARRYPDGNDVTATPRPASAAERICVTPPRRSTGEAARVPQRSRCRVTSRLGMRLRDPNGFCSSKNAPPRLAIR